mmetsp:Transcript_6822/g.18545  ORF Transcript_6822/g.18545 Transcript_6822/m.18545 type:complete len:202 (-) Transcript_6822:957-1562(-)
MPVTASQLLDVLLRRPETGQSNLLREIREVGVGEHRGVPQKLMTDVWLWRVHGLGVMANILGGEEDSECKTIQEVPRRQQASDWSHTEACAITEEVVDILRLRDVVSTVSAVFLHHRHGLLELPAGVLIPKRLHLCPHRRPCVNFTGRVFHMLDFLVPGMFHCMLGQLIATVPVFFVREAWVVALQVDAHIQCAMRDQIQF